MRGDMLDIAIIDDDIEAIKAIKKILANIKIVDFVESYVSFNDFFKAADSGNHYDVILLDIQFNEHQKITRASIMNSNTRIGRKAKAQMKNEKTEEP